MLLATHWSPGDALSCRCRSAPLRHPQRRRAPGGAFGHLDGCHLLLEYCDLLDLHPTPWRMVKGHAFQLLGARAAGGWQAGSVRAWRLLGSRAGLFHGHQDARQLRGVCRHVTPASQRHPGAAAAAGPWLTEFTDLREALNRSHDWGVEQLRGLAMEVLARIEVTGRTHPVPALSARALARMEAEAAKAAAIEEQQREAQALQQLAGEPGAASGAAADAEQQASEPLAAMAGV